MYGNFPKETDRKVHRPLLPSNHGYKAELIFADQTVPVVLGDYTSFGFSLITDEQYDELCFPGQITVIQFSPLIEQQYAIKAQIIEMDRVNNQLRISLRVMADSFKQVPKYRAIPLTGSHRLTGQIFHPFQYKTLSFFEINEVSKEGFLVSGIQPEFTLFTNMEIAFNLGMFQPSNPIRGRVSSIKFHADGTVQCFIHIIKKLPPVLTDNLNKYLMRYTSSTPEEIRNAGFAVKTVKEFIQYKYAETQADYEAVLRTRRFAYSGVNKIDAEANLEKVSYFFDDYSHILMVMHNDEIIGSATIIVGDGNQKPFEIQTFFDKNALTDLPPSTETLEIAALCLHPDYRDTDILHGIFEQIYMLTMMLNKNYIIASSDKYLLNLYQSIGFKLTEHEFIQPKYNDLAMHVLVIHRDAAIRAKGVKKLIWWPLWGIVNSHLIKKRVIRYRHWERIKAKLLRKSFKVMFFIRYRRHWQD